MPYWRSWRLRKSPDVHLVNDGVLHGTVERPVALPAVSGGVDDTDRIELAMLSSGPQAAARFQTLLVLPRA
jgi:hypothetical protein